MVRAKRKSGVKEVPLSEIKDLKLFDGFDDCEGSGF